LLAILALALGAWQADAMNIQTMGAGARSAALGSGFVAVADDGDAVFANPAGLGLLAKRQVAYTNVSMLLGGIEGDDLGQHLFSYAQPLGANLGVGLGYERIGSDLMSENGAFLGLAWKASQRVKVGVTAKYEFWSVGDIPDDNGRPDPLSNASKGAVGLDVGLLWKTPLKGAQLGVQVKNLLQPNVASKTKVEVQQDWTEKNADGTVLKEWKKGETYTLQSDAGKIPMDLAVGASYPVGTGSLVTVAWVRRDVSGESSSRLVVSGETKVVEGLMLRGGGAKVFEEDASGDVDAGLGYRMNRVLFDYGYHISLDLTETNGAHRFSLGYEF
jgi:hypothetical protein